MAPIVVDPRALDGAGQSVDAQAEALGKAIDTLHSALSGSSGMSGDDPAGIVHGRAYDNSAKAILVAMVDLRNGMARMGDGLRASATSYSRAEVASNVHGAGGAPLPAAPPTAAIGSHLPPSAQGSNEGAPPGWSLVEPFLGMIWPDGSPSKLRAAAGAWTAAGSAFLAAEAPLLSAVGVVDGQQIPEGAQITKAVVTGNNNATALFGQCVKVASNLNSYAGNIEAVHAAILDLLSRIVNPMTGVREVWDLLTGNDNDEIKKIADDIRVVINNFKSEVEALATLLAPLVQEAEAIAQAMASWAKMEIEQFGDAAYNALADVVNAGASFGNAMLNNPLDTLGMIGGAAVMVGGATLEIPGTLLDATGVGAIAGVPVNAAGVAMMAGGATLAGGSAIDLAHQAELQPVTVMHANTSQPRDPATGKYTGYDHVSADKEAQGIEEYADANPNRVVVPNNRYVKFEEGAGPMKPGPGGTDVPRVRSFDGYSLPKDLKPDPDGYVPAKGLEVKSGGAGPSPNQKNFDPHISPQTPAYGTAVLPDGRVIPVKVTEVAPEIHVK